jgi:hypothetical protein
MGASSGKRKKKRGEKHDDHTEITVPICFGDVSTADAARIKGLWENTWSQDARSKKAKTKKK